MNGLRWLQWMAFGFSRWVLWMQFWNGSLVRPENLALFFCLSVGIIASLKFAKCLHCVWFNNSEIWVPANFVLPVHWWFDMFPFCVNSKENPSSKKKPSWHCYTNNCFSDRRLYFTTILYFCGNNQCCVGKHIGLLKTFLWCKHMHLWWYKYLFHTG